MTKLTKDNTAYFCSCSNRGPFHNPRYCENKQVGLVTIITPAITPDAQDTKSAEEVK